jgi:hypothetical protein
MLDKRLAAIREKDAVIPTYSADVLITSPAIVEVVYSTHASTHMSMGDTSTFVEKLIHWTHHNKGCVIGTIVGRYGYGKTSTAVHLWHGHCPSRWWIIPVASANPVLVDFFVSGQSGEVISPWCEAPLESFCWPLHHPPHDRLLQPHLA